MLKWHKCAPQHTGGCTRAREEDWISRPPRRASRGGPAPSPRPVALLPPGCPPPFPPTWHSRPTERRSRRLESIGPVILMQFVQRNISTYSHCLDDCLSRVSGPQKTPEGRRRPWRGSRSRFDLAAAAAPFARSPRRWRGESERGWRSTAPPLQVLRQGAPRSTLRVSAASLLSLHMAFFRFGNSFPGVPGVACSSRAVETTGGSGLSTGRATSESTASAATTGGHRAHPGPARSDSQDVRREVNGHDSLLSLTVPPIFWFSTVGWMESTCTGPEECGPARHLAPRGSCEGKNGSCVRGDSMRETSCGHQLLQELSAQNLWQLFVVSVVSCTGSQRRAPVPGLVIDQPPRGAWLASGPAAARWYYAPAPPPSTQWGHP